MDLNDLGNDLEKLALGFPAQADKIVRLVALESLKNLVLSTPVDTGRARSNWFATVDFPSEQITDDTDFQSNLHEESSKLLSSFRFNTIWISNNLPYILRLNDGWSKQAPIGFIEKSIKIAERSISKAKIEA